MTDENLEQHLRNLPGSALPETWRAEILSSVCREARSSSPQRQVWPPLLVFLRNLCLRNPITAGAMVALWMLIFVFKAGTPVDPDEKMLLAHFDPNRPVRLDCFREQVLLAEYLQDQEQAQEQYQRP